MLKFFRRIRRKLIDDGNLKKYLIYAFGEILLVVIGILIALQINTWNTSVENSKKELSYLKYLTEDLSIDTSTYGIRFRKGIQKKIAGLTVAKNYNYGDYMLEDTADFINTVGFGGLYGLGNFVFKNSTYDELLSTGNLGLIQNRALRKKITDYYSGIDRLIITLNSTKTDYANRLNGIRDWKTDIFDDDNALDDKEVKTMLEAIKREDFLQLINKELTNSSYIESRLNRVVENAKMLLLEINKERQNRL